MLYWKDNFAEQKYVLITGDGLKTGGQYTDNSDDLEVMNKDGTTKLCSAKSKYPLKIVDASGMKNSVF